MHNAPKSKSANTSTTIKKWLPSVSLAIIIHLFFIGLLLYSNPIKQPPTNNSNTNITNPLSKPQIMTTELTVDNNINNENDIESKLTINNATSTTDKKTTNGESQKEYTINNDTASTDKKVDNQTTNKQKTPNETILPKKELTKMQEEADVKTTTVESNTKALDTHNGSTNNTIVDKKTENNVNQNKGNAILIEGIDTPKNEAINTVKDQLVDTNQEVEKLDEQNKELKEEVAEIHTQTASKIGAIIKYNQQVIEQNNQKQKIEFEQHNEPKEQNK